MPDYPRPRLPQHLLPLSVPVFQILLSLADRHLHGYAIIQDIRQRTDGEVVLTASTLYAAIKRMLDGGLIVELGTHEELMKLDGLYARLYSLQFRDPREVLAIGQDGLPALMLGSSC
jgi:hypothetical protein